jgi:hypothetical protein
VKWLSVILVSLIFVSCEKIPYDQYYVFENKTDTTIVLYMNPPGNTSDWYYITNPSVWVQEIWPPKVTAIIEPHGKYILHGTMICDYYNEQFAVWGYPVKYREYPMTERIKHLNIIEKDGISHDNYH